MKLNGIEFETVDGKEQDLFAYMDTLEKKVVTTTVDKDGLPEVDESKHSLLEVDNHAILLPPHVPSHFKEQGWIEFK